MVSIALESFAFEQITVGSSATGLTEATYAPSGNPQARRALIQNIGGQTVRYRTDGAEPTSSSGHELADGDTLTLETTHDIASFRAIREGSSNSALAVTYQR